MHLPSSQPSRSAGLFAAVLVAAGLSLPAHAATMSANATQAQPTGQAQPRADRRANERQICVLAEFSETRIRRRVCKTARQWEAEGGVPERD